MRPAVVLLSGGLDSRTCSRWRAKRDSPRTRSRSATGSVTRSSWARPREWRARWAAVKTVSLDLRWIGGSALTGDREVPKDAPIGAGIPVTYVPARNTVLLALALGYAETLDAQDLYIGVNAIDYSGYPDCRPAFVKAFETLANVATAAAVQGRAAIKSMRPLIALSKAQIIQRGEGWRALRLDAFLLRPGRGGPRLRPVRLLPAPRPGLPRGRRAGSDRLFPEVNHAQPSRPLLIAQAHVHGGDAGAASDKDSAVPAHQAHPLDASAPKPQGKMTKLSVGKESSQAYVAHPKGKPQGALLVIHEYWGLNDWVKQEADLLAQQGYLALAIDLYKGRSRRIRKRPPR